MSNKGARIFSAILTVLILAGIVFYAAPGNAKALNPFILIAIVVMIGAFVGLGNVESKSLKTTGRVAIGLLIILSVIGLLK